MGVKNMVAIIVLSPPKNQTPQRLLLPQQQKTATLPCFAKPARSKVTRPNTAPTASTAAFLGY